MDIKIFEEIGWGYSKLAVVVDAALRKLGANHRFQIIGNPNLFSDYDVTNPPTLMVDGDILIEGYIPIQEEMVEILKDKILF